jgi:hypothetical protein
VFYYLAWRRFLKQYDIGIPRRSFFEGGGLPAAVESDDSYGILRLDWFCRTEQSSQ